MYRHIYLIATLLFSGLFFLLELPTTTASNAPEQALLHVGDDGSLFIETANDQNVTFRLMGDASTLLLNDMDILTLLEQRQRVVEAAQSTAVEPEPLSLDALKEQFRGVQRDLTRLARWTSNMRNGTRRSGLTQRVLRRTLQRVQLVGNTLQTLESNLLTDECSSNPCKHGGTCIDSYKSFHCNCPTNWQGATCEDDVNECFDLAITDLAVCKNNAQCINTPGSYRCICRPGYSGTHCQLQHNVCLANQSAELCGSHGTCLISSNAAGFVCICDQGWTWADTNVSMASASPCTRDVDECAPEINPCHNECINLPGSFRCGACPPGYTGDGKYCRDTDECADGNNGGCSQRPRVSCINTEGSYRCGPCPRGWTGDGKTCEVAKSNSCNGERICHPLANCEYISDTVVCSCPVGYFGHGYGDDGCTEDADRKPCDDHPCLNNGTCVLSGRGTSCICQPGYKGALCNESDSCHPNPCQNDGICRLLPDNEFMCVCGAGYSGSTCSNLRSFCGIILRNETGSLQFPPSEDNSQMEYQPRERCPFIIATRRGMILNVTFGLFDLESSNDCTADFLQLHDGSSLTARLIGRFCGNKLPRDNGTVMTTQEQMFLWFQSNNATQGRGFNLTWSSKPMVCGEHLNLEMGQSGVLRSPSYPGKTRPGINCRWHLEAPFGTRLLLHFYEINLGLASSPPTQAMNCSNGDYLKILDSDQQLFLACQSEEPEPLYSSSNQLNIHFHTDLLRMDSSFQLHYEVVKGHPNCGGIFTEPRGLITGHMITPVCLYLIQQPTGTQIEIKFDRVRFLTHGNCQLQRLEIFDGRTEDGRLLKRFCGQPQDSELQPIISSGNVVLMRYEYALAGLELLAYNFQLRYSRVCNVNFTEAVGGIITTPNYPNGYLENMDCIFNIVGPLNRILYINITDLSLSGTQLSDAPQDDDDDDDEDSAINVGLQPNYLDVYLSRNESEKQRFTKNLTNFVLASTNNQLRLIFHGANNPQRARGLRVEYKIISGGCGGVLTAPKASLTKLLNGMPCQWIIEVPGRKHLRVSSRVYMRGFAMYIYDNSTSGEAKLLRSFEQQNEDRNFQMNEYTDSNLITIYVPRMSTLSFLRIEYEPAEQTCGGSFQSHYGIIKTPNWPEHYGSSENCTWVIMASMGERIELIVHNFTLESTKTCRDDYLEIRNGDNVGSPLLGRYCGSSIPSRFPSFGNALYLHFQSDAMVEKQGFYLNWQLGASGCGGKLTSMNGAIHSPHSIADNSGAVSCDWQISVSLGSTVYMELQSRDDLCKGLLIIYDGPTTRSPKLKMNCSDNGEQMKLLSSGHQVLVRYDVHEDSPEGLSFVLDYSTNCRTRLEQLHGAIETPNFPENYPPNTNCEWDIRSGEGSNHVQLSFSHINLENEDSNCETDYVLLRDYRDNQLISERRLCVAEDEIISSVGNRLLMQFKSDGIMENQGFHAEYRRLGCGEELQVNETSFETPNAPYSVDLDCYWHITVPEGYQISLLLQELHIETTQRDCSQDSLTIWAGTNASDVILRSCQVESSTQTYLSPANELHVRFRSSPQRARKYLKASYSQLPARCGGYVSASSGVIASPSYYQQDLDIYDKDIECVWTIEVTDSYGIQLDFETFNLTGNCQKADLQVSGSTTVSDAEYVQQECGGDHIDSITLKNKVKVHFKATAGSWGKFAIRYQQICGGIRIADEGYLNSRLDTTCYWTIQGPEGSKISLNINQMECPACTAPAGNCTAGLRVLNAEDEVTYYNLCKEHPATVMVPTNKARIEAVGIVLSAQYTTIDNTCGGNITSARGTLSSPNYPESYPANVECDWVFKPRAGNAFELNFEVMDIAKSEHCNVDFLEVRSDHHGPLLGLYCGNDLPVEPIVSSTEIWIKFRSLPGSSGNGFKLHWSYVHDIELNGTSGIIESPPTLLVRGDEQSYTWRIFPELNSVIVMDFREYNTGLQLFDGFDETGISIDIGNSPWQFISSNNVLYLKTVNTDFDAFRLEWKIMQKNLPKEKPLTEVCNMLITLDKETEMEINTPNYPHKYNPIMNCEWTFKPSDVTRHVVINLSEANLGSLGECGVDYLSIETSRNLVNWQEIVRACNMSANPHKTPLLTVHGTPNLKVKFVTEKLVNGSGFSTDLYTDCGSNMTEPVGTITSSNLQRSLFAGSAICEWHIDVRPGRVIDINIEYNGKPLNINCMHYGLIYDGLDAGAPLLPNGKFCNQLNMSTGSYRTSGPHAFIRYYMPTNINNTNPQRNNWTLTYREYRDCHNEIQLTHLASSYALNTPGYPDYPQTFADCIWLIRAPVGETIAANFVDAFDLSTHDCDKEFVELFDGSTMLARRLLRTCRRPGTQRSTGNTLLVHYESTITDPHFGFKLNVSLSQCGGQHIARTGIITSEHYPALGAYPKPADCEYTIKSYKNSHLIVNISDIHLPYDANAKAEAMDRIEFLDLMDQRRIMLILYGNETNLPYTTTLYSYEVAVRFVATSTKLNIYRGFRLEYKSKDMVCTRSTDAASGEMEIRRAVIYVKNPIDCRWHITVPKGQRVRLEIVNLSELRSQLPGEHPIDLDFSFYNDYRQFSEIINFNIKSYNGSGIIESSDNVMTVSVLLYREMTRKTIRMRFSSNEASPCPPDIGKQAAGMVSNQELINMPTYYCSIKLLAEPFETISFKTVYSQQGGNGYVDFNNDNPWTRETLPRGNATIATAMKSGYIVISQSALSDHLRFQATYKRYPCGGHFKLTEGLIIELPELTEHFGVLECMWTLDNSGDFGIRTLSSFSDSCDNEYVELHLDNKLSRYCRNDVQTFNLTRGADIYKVHYHATQYHSRISSFQLLATKYNYLSGQGEIANLEDKPTPPVTIDRTTYKNNIELSWEFQTNQYMTLQLEFRDRFFIELAPNCRNDQLEVLSYQSDLWQPIATLCGRELPQPLHVQSNRMRIVFRTNGNITGDGFTFVVTPTCDVKLEATSELQTVNGGRGYQGKFKGIRQCKYEFTTNSKHPLVVVVKGIDGTKWTELTCRISSFKAYRLLEGKPENEQLISNKLCPEFEISGLGYLRVVSTATAIINKPFQLQYQVIGCGDNYTTPFILRTPLDESGDFYKRSFNCEWHVLAPPQHAIFLSFQYFELEKECQFDKLFIYRGRSQSKEQRVSELCGNITAASIMIDSNEALIVANLPGYSLQSGRGFLATVSFTPNCNEHLVLDEGNNRTSLVRQYHLNGTNNADGLHCYFRASAPPGYRLSISLKQLQLNVPVCATCSSLEIIDGFDTYSPSLGTYYATMGNGTKLFSSTNELLIKLSGSQPSESISFELMLQMEATICGQVEYKLERNEIINIHLHSNNISANYEGNIHCVWHFTSESDILIDMHAVQLPDVSSSTRKCIDYLLIKGIYVGSKTYCGQFNNTSLYVMAYGGIDIIFHGAGGDAIFAMDFSVKNAEKCNRTLTLLDGALDYYSSEINDTNNCVNVIRVPPGFSIALELEAVQFMPSESTAYLNITDLRKNINILNATEGYQTPVSILGNSNVLRIATSGVTYLKLFYHSNLNILPPGCGGELTSLEGQFANPNYDNRDYSECNWRISVPAGNLLRFAFKNFDMGPLSNCQLDNMKFYELLPDNSEILRQTFCGQGVPEDFITHSNRFKIVAKKSPNFVGTGFQLYYYSIYA